MITQSSLKELLHYEPETGDFIWRVSRGRVRSGMLAGTHDEKGYLKIQIDKQPQKAHRLAWLCMKGEWPKNVIDHINGQQGDNRWENLRMASISQNAWNSRTPDNNTSGFKGVTYHKRDKHWCYQVKTGVRREWVGGFDTADAAAEASKAARETSHGKYANSGDRVMVREL